MKEKKWNSVLFYPKNGKMYLWDKRSFDKSNGYQTWREVLGRFYLKHCEDVFYKAKGSYEKLG